MVALKRKPRTTQQQQEERKHAAVAGGIAAGAAAGASHKGHILSPYKLYKHDMSNQRRAVTWGPKGKPYKGKAGKDMFGCKGSVCYSHKHVDWTVHRLAPATIERSKPGSKRRRLIAKVEQKVGGSSKPDKRIGTRLKETSPRWGKGIAPGLRERHVVQLPKVGQASVSRKTKVAVGAVAGGAAVYGGYRGVKAYQQHRAQQQAADKNPRTPAKIGTHVKTKTNGRVRRKR